MKFKITDLLSVTNDTDRVKVAEFFSIGGSLENVKSSNRKQKDVESVFSPDKGILTQIEEKLGLVFVQERETEGQVCFANSMEVRPEFRQSFTLTNLLEYLYAMLHSKVYREEHDQFLEADFPGISYPEDTFIFWKLVELGGELRQVNLQQVFVGEKSNTRSLAKRNRLVSEIDRLM